MAEAEKKDYEVEFEFPDEKEAKVTAAVQQEAKGKSEVDIDIEDDTPEADRGREPMPKELVEKLDKDELDTYDEEVKTKLKQLKKVWHDERRVKEQALREQQEALDFAKRVLEENKRLKTTLSDGEKTLVDTAKGAAELELEMAKRAYKEAYEAGDADRVVDAQAKLAEANYKLQRVKDYKPSLQQPEIVVNNETEAQVQVPRPDQKTLAWQERNRWFGVDEEMTSLALGLHQKLEKQNGRQYVGSDEYWGAIDKTMRKRFPEYFGDEEVQTTSEAQKPSQRAEVKAATVVAPASRSTSSKRIVLKQREVTIAKRLGLTPEQYAREKQRLENLNG